MLILASQTCVRGKAAHQASKHSKQRNYLRGNNQSQIKPHWLVGGWRLVIHIQRCLKMNGQVRSPYKRSFATNTRGYLPIANCQVSYSTPDVYNCTVCVGDAALILALKTRPLSHKNRDTHKVMTKQGTQ